MARIIVDCTDKYKEDFVKKLNGRTQKEFIQEAINEKFERETEVKEDIKAIGG